MIIIGQIHGIGFTARLPVLSDRDDILVWTGVSHTFYPKNLHKAINGHGLVILIRKQMHSDGVVPWSGTLRTLVMR